jgi:hypothetical protein
MLILMDAMQILLKWINQVTYSKYVFFKKKICLQLLLIFFFLKGNPEFGTLLNLTGRP